MLESFLNKVTGLNACNFIKKRLQHRHFPVKFAKFWKTSILKTIFEQLYFAHHEALNIYQSSIFCDDECFGDEFWVSYRCQVIVKSIIMGYNHHNSLRDIAVSILSRVYSYLCLLIYILLVNKVIWKWLYLCIKTEIRRQHGLFQKMWIKKQYNFSKTIIFFFTVVFCPLIGNIY